VFEMTEKKMEIMEAIKKQAKWCAECFNNSELQYLHETEVARFNGMIEMANIIGITDEEIEQAVNEAKN
jgi:DNA-binding phage protein